VDEALHRQYTGLDNRPILHNLQVLGRMGTSFVLRVPLIPGVTDMPENLEATAQLALASNPPQSVLP
jgi:pyruvate formate lyase activating enzyme